MALLLRYSDPGAADHPHHARFATVTPGAPGRCPDCDSFGYLDHLDTAGRVQTQHCRTCHCAWEYRFDASGRIEEVHERQRMRPSRPPVTIDLTSGPSNVVDLRSRDREPAN